MARARFLCCERSSCTNTTMPRRQMGDADRRFGLVDVLAAGALRAHGVDLQVGIVDGDVDVLGLRQHGDGRGGGVDAALRLGVRHALHPVHAALELQPREDAAALDLGRRFPCSRRPCPRSPR